MVLIYYWATIVATSSWFQTRKDKDQHFLGVVRSGSVLSYKEDDPYKSHLYPSGRRITSILSKGQIKKNRDEQHTKNTEKKDADHTKVQNEKKNTITKDDIKTQTQTGATDDGKTKINAYPKVHFLFLAVDKIGRPDIWTRFLAQADRNLYRVYVHCKNVASCEKQKWPDNWSLIKDPVATSYCDNLVGGEIRLLQEGLTESGPLDQFVLLSDSTLPVKNFDEMYRMTMETPKSKFCVFPKKQWAIVKLQETPPCIDQIPTCDPNSIQCLSDSNYVSQCAKSCKKCFTDSIINHGVINGSYVMAIKTHQWKVLTQIDALNSVQKWHSGYLRDLLHVFHMNWNDAYHNTGCLDEFWHFAALRGTFFADCGENTHPNCDEWSGHGQCSSNTEYMLKACPVSCSNCSPTQPHHPTFLDELNFSEEAGSQGICNTYTRWDPSIGWTQATHPLENILANEAEATTSLLHPDTIMRISLKGLQALRDSPFLFARKFTPDMQVRDACDVTVADAIDHIMRGSVLVPKAPGQIFGGVWLAYNYGEKYEVSVLGDPRANQLNPLPEFARAIVIQNGHDKAWSGQGTYCGEKVSVTFANGQSLTALLENSGDTLQWSNGVRWYRDNGWVGEGAWETLMGTNNVVLLRAYGGGAMVTLNALTDPHKHGSGYVDDTGRLSVHFNSGREAIGTLTGGRHITWPDGSMWTRKGTPPPCSCLPDNMSWVAPPPERPKKCIWVEVTATPTQQPGTEFCERLHIWPGHLGFGFMCDSPHWSSIAQPTVNIMRIIREHVNMKDEVVLVLGKDFVYAWDVLPCFSRSNTARLVDMLKLDTGLSLVEGSVYGTQESEKQDILFRLRQTGMQVDEKFVNPGLGPITA